MLSHANIRCALRRHIDARIGVLKVGEGREPLTG
jgi:hypothetical protein